MLFRSTSPRSLADISAILIFTVCLLSALFVCSESLAQSAATTAGAAKFLPMKIKSGDPAPGMAEGITLARQGNTLVGADGKVLCMFELNGPGVKGPMQAGKDICPNDEALFMETNDGFKLLLREGDAVLPDHPDLQVFRIQLCSFIKGNPVVMAQLGNKPRIQNPYCAVFNLQDGKLQPILQTGAAAANGKLTRFDDLHRSVYRRNGNLTFRSRLQADGSPPAGIKPEEPDGSDPNHIETQRIVKEAMRNMPTGLWSGTPNNLQPIALSGEPVPKQEGFVFQKIDSFAQNAKGEVAFEAIVRKADKSGSPSYGVWQADAAGKPRMVSGNIEGLPAGAKISGFEFIQLNDNGQLAVSASYVIEGGKDRLGGSAIVLIEDGHAKVLIQSGDSVSGTNVTANAFTGLKFSSAGIVAVTYTFGEKGKRQKTGLLVVDPANPTDAKSIMAEGGAVPGMASDVVYGKLSWVAVRFVTPHTIAFFNRLSNKNYGAFISTKGEPAQPLVATGIELEIDGSKRVVKDANGLAFANMSYIAESGYLPLNLRFADRKRVKIIAELSKD